MNFEQFGQWRAEMRHTHTSLVDLSETNLYRSLSTRFEPLGASAHAQAKYRCHFVERFVPALGLELDVFKARALASHGVRRSLAALFGWLAAQGARVALPSDVYPVYWSLAEQAGLSVQPYEARLGLPLLESCDALLVCEPLKPWGGGLSEADTARLLAWGRSRVLLIDSAYSVPPTQAARRLVLGEAALLLASLSKGWLVPDHGGVCVVPPRFVESLRPVFAALHKDELRQRIAFGALHESPERVEQVTAHLRERAAWLDSFTQSRPSLRARRCEGYFAVSECSVGELLQQSVLAVPASVFGGPSSMSILSSLEMAPAPLPAV